MTKLVEVAITAANLKCDSLGCGYTESVEISADLIDKPCPKCGANLLTREDYNAAQKLLAIFAAINAGIGPAEESGEAIKVSFNPRAV